MNVTEAIAEVLRITKRPDKEADAISAINRAVSYCTIKGEFRRDIIIASIAIDATTYGGTVDLSTLTRFRRFSYVKPTARKYYMTPLSGDKIFTPKDNMQVNRYYISGTSMVYTLSELANALETEYYSYPVVLDKVTNKTHWMLDLMPHAIIDLASARVFASIGDDASASRYERSGMDNYVVVRKDLSAGE